MKIRGQIWIKKSNNYYLTRLHQPYWGAWKEYGWDQGICGIGISSEMVNKAIRNNCGIVINITKYGVYRINPNKLERLKGNLFKAHDGKYLYEYPLIEFDRVEKPKEEIKEKEIKELKRYLQAPLC
jgi:hypothetical protein